MCTHLTLTRVVFESKVNGFKITPPADLTLTRVVFEFLVALRLVRFCVDLTLTRVVFESALLQWIDTKISI